MPLINFNQPAAREPSQQKIDQTVDSLLKSAGFAKEDASLSAALAEHNLSTKDCIEELSHLARNGTPADSVRLKAVETGLKMNGALTEKTAAPSNFTIVINGAVGINPILLPR